MSDAEKLKLALKALEYIVTHEGRVCDNYEMCTHESCSSSHISWDVAYEALQKITENKNEPR